MNWRHLFDRPVGFNPLLGPGATEATFLTTQALVSFSGASLAISIIRAVIQNIWPATSGDRLTGLVLAFVVGLVIWLIGITDPAAQMTRRDKVIGLFLAFINSCTLYLASQGLLSQVGLAAK
jgi:hypothetical protein